MQFLTFRQPSFQKHTSLIFTMTFRRLPRLLSTCSRLSSDHHQTNFVSLVRLQDKIRSDEATCRKELEKGKIMLVHKGRPLITDDREVAWTGYEEAKTKWNKSLDEEFVFLRLHPETGEPVFAVPVHDETKVEGGMFFADLRLAIFSVDDDHALLRHAWSLLSGTGKPPFAQTADQRPRETFPGAR